MSKKKKTEKYIKNIFVCILYNQINFLSRLSRINNNKKKKN